MSTTPAASTEIRSGVAHLRAITGLRFVAAVAVYISHLNLTLFPADRQLAIGGPAVSFFFVLSGFILTWVYSDRLQWKSVRRFYFTRWVRIWPLHICCLILFLVLVQGVTAPGFETNGPANLVAATTLLHSWVPVSSWYIGFNSVSWSISTEMFFYLAFPMLLLGMRRNFPAKFMVVALSSLATVTLIQSGLDSGALPDWLLPMYVAVACPITRLFEFVLGMATCQWMFARHGRGAAGDRIRSTGAESIRELAVIGLLCLAWYLAWEFRLAVAIRNSSAGGITFANWFRMASGAPFYALVIYVFARSHGIIGKILGSAAAVWLGEISYAFYLIHQIILRTMDGMRIPDWQFIGLSFGLALFSSALLFRIVEMPVKNAALCWYDGRRRQAGRQALAGIRSAFTCRRGWAECLGLAALLITCLLIQDPVAEQRMIDGIIAGTPTEFRDVEFQGEAVLLGFRAQPASSGVLLELAWRRLPQQQRTRILHVCDQQGAMVGLAPGGQKAFSAVPPNDVFVEQVVVRKRNCRGGVSLAAGFWSRDTGFAPVRYAGRPATPVNHIDSQNRLHFLQIDRIR